MNGMPVIEGLLADSVTRITTLEYVMNFGPCAGFSLVCECPLLDLVSVSRTPNFSAIMR